MALSSINNDELLKKRLLDDKGVYDFSQFGIKADQQGGGVAQTFAEKYGSETVFGVDPGQFQGDVQKPTFQTMGAQAGSSANPVTDNNSSTSQTFSLADALQMDNLPSAPTVTAVQTPVVPSAINATGGNEASDKQGGATSDHGKPTSSGYQASHNALLASLSWGTETVSNSAAPTAAPTTENTPPASSPKPTGEATLSTESENPGDKSSVESPTAEGTPSPNGGENTVNPNDSANETSDNKGDNGAGEGGADGSGKSADQVAQEEADKQAQILLQQQQEKALEEQRRNAA